MATGIRITSQKEGTAFLPGGTTNRVITTTFMVDNDGPFSVSQDESTFDANTQQALIIQKADKIRATRQHPSISS
jgi:hypothetical protein